MAFPWSRGESAAQDQPADRRRARGRRARQDEVRRERSRAGRERQHQRVAIGIGAGLILVILGILSFGYYQEFYKPPRVWAGSVNDVEFTMGDLVQRLRVLQGLTGQVDLGRQPFEYLQYLLNVELLRQEAPLLGFGVTDADIDEVIKDQFSPPAVPEQETDPGQLNREFEENYQAFLTRSGLSKQDFRVVLEEQLLLQYLHAWRGLSIGETQEQVEVKWIRLDLDGGIEPVEVRERLNSQDFAAVLADVGAPDQFADSEGYVGWVPRQAFPFLDEVLFGDEEKGKQPLGVGENSELVFTQDAGYIVHKLAGPEERELADNIRAKLNDELVIKWQRNQQTRGSKEKWLRLNFDSKWYEWVAEQVNISAPLVPLGQR